MNHKSGSLLFEPQKWITSDLTASVDGGPSGWSRVRRPGSETPIGASGISYGFHPELLNLGYQVFGPFIMSPDDINVDLSNSKLSMVSC